MNITKLFLHISTLGPLGHLTASGTVATIVTIPFVVGIRSLFPGDLANGLFIILFVIFSLFAIHQALVVLHRAHDPYEIVLDEVVGCFITFWAIPLTAQSL